MSDFEFRNPEQRAKKKPPVLKLSKKGLGRVDWSSISACAVVTYGKLQDRVIS